MFILSLLPGCIYIVQTIFTKSYVQALKAESQGIRSGYWFFFLLSVLLVGVTVWLSGKYHKSATAKKIAGISTRYSNQLAEAQRNLNATNSYYSEKIGRANETIGDFRERLKFAEHDKDVLRAERDKAQSELAPWITLAKSQYTNTPLTESMDKLYQSIVENFREPTFELKVNNTAIPKGTNIPVISLDTNRTITFEIENTGPRTAQELVIDFGGNIDSTNFAPNHWSAQYRQDDKGFHWNLTAQNPIANGNSFICHPLTISKGLTNIPAFIGFVRAYSVGSKRHDWTVFFVLQDHLQKQK